MVCFFMLTITAISFCQPPANKHILSSDEYLKKSKRQNKTGWILLGGGIVLPAIAILVATQIKHGSDAPLIIVSGGVILSSLAIPVSIPFFISSHHNKKNAVRLSVKNESIVRLSNNYFSSRFLPSLSLKINL